MVVIGGGDILQPWNIDPRYWNTDYLKKPTWVAGIGVPLRANIRQEWIMDKMKRILEMITLKAFILEMKLAKWLNKRMDVAHKLHGLQILLQH